MTLRLFFFIATVLFSLQPALADYNQTDALEYTYASVMSYCSTKSIKAWNCNVCGNLTDYKLYFTQQFDISIFETLSFSMIYNPTSKRFITAFRGSIGQIELLLEIIERSSVPYQLSNITGAAVDEYFYDHYVSTFRKVYFTQLQQAIKEFPDYTFITTGHSLGAALATIGAYDAVASGVVPAQQMVLYNFGSPRVGNYEFAQAVESTLPVKFRVTHWRDMIPHVPFCQQNLSGNCNITGPNETGLASWPAYHISQEVFYNENSTQYKICNGGEDLTCSDQFKIEDTTFLEHLQYLGVSMICVDGENADLISHTFGAERFNKINEPFVGF